MHQHDDPTAPTYQTPSRLPRGTPRKVWAIRWVFPTQECLPTVIERDRVTVGRSRACDARLEGQEVSARHAVLERVDPGGGILIRDHESTNGVHVNGLRLTPTESRRLEEGDVVRLGEFVGIVEQIPSTEADQPTRIERREIAIQLDVETDRGVRRTERQTLGLVVGPSTEASIGLVEKAAPTECTVILVGETGTGKEYVAKALHAWSKRPGRYVGLNCWELRGDPGLARAKLFGVESGAFAGAVPVKGAFRDADRGTLLLDEVMELPLEVQPMLLRTLQEKLVQPIGGRRPVSVDVRLVVASKRPLDEMVEAGAFALDLYQRLAGLTVELAPLRDRKTDIPFAFVSALASTVRTPDRAPLARARDVEPVLVEQLCRYPWPGNLRELVTLAGNYRRLWDRSAEPGYRFRLQDLPYQFYGDKPNPTGKDRDRRDAAQLAALIGALRTLVGSRLQGAPPLRREDLNFGLACERAGVQRSLGYRQFKKWEKLAAKGLIELPSDELEQALYRWYAEGKKA
jgi:transcriptional regulator with PAS, ATPase and Fis domain